MKFKKKTFSDGLRLIVVPMAESPTVTTLVMVEAGSKYETRQQNGLSHFLEHMCFKGTTKRPRSLDISHELDSLGAESNAFTSTEYTGYYAKAHPKHTEQLIDVISDLYLNPRFPQEELEKEKGVVLEEMNMYEDLPQRKVQEVFTELLYGDQPAGWTILGRKEVIIGAKIKDLTRYREDHYCASSTVVIVSGNVKVSAVERLVGKYFKEIPKTKKKKKNRVIDRQGAPNIKIHFKKTDQAHLVLGFRTFPVSDKRNAILQVLNAVLGSGMSSRLFQKLREEMGVGYYVRSGVDELTDHGYFAVATGVDTTRVLEVVKAILSLCRDLKDHLVSQEELEKSKESLIGNFVMGLESSDSIATFVADQELIKGKIESPKDIERKIRQVTSEDVRTLARTIFSDKNLNLAVVGNIKEAKALRAILKVDME